MPAYRTKFYEEFVTRVYTAFVMCNSPYPLVRMAAAIEEAFKSREAWVVFRDPEPDEIVAGVAYFKKDESGQWFVFDRNSKTWARSDVKPVAWKSDLEMHDAINGGNGEP